MALASAVLFLVYPLTQWHAEQSLVVAELGPVVTRQSTEAFGRISISTLWCCLRWSHLEIWRIISTTSSYLTVFASVSGCCLWSTGHWIFREILESCSCALVGSTVNTCSASVLGCFWTNGTYFLRRGGLGSRGVLSPCRCRMGEVCSAGASSGSSAQRCSHLEI